MTAMENRTKLMEIEEWLRARGEAGLKINPETAKVYWRHGQVLNPYGLDLDLPEGGHRIGRFYFARSPENEIWVEFGDLPDTTRTALEDRKDEEPPWPFDETDNA
jgi:hypothetical protein